MKRHPTPSGPLSRRFDVAAVRDGPVAFRVEATAAERKALAAECGLPGLDALAADLSIRRDGPDGLRVTGRVAASVWQTCVVTLEAFASRLDEEVDVCFAPEDEVAARAARPSRGEDEPEPEDPPDPIVGGRVDVGALVAEVLVLGLDPYPRKPGASFEDPRRAASDDHGSPFGVLRDFKGPGGT